MFSPPHTINIPFCPMRPYCHYEFIFIVDVSFSVRNILFYRKHGLLNIRFHFIRSSFLTLSPSYLSNLFFDINKCFYSMVQPKIKVFRSLRNISGALRSFNSFCCRFLVVRHLNPSCTKGGMG